MEAAFPMNFREDDLAYHFSQMERFESGQLALKMHELFRLVDCTLFRPGEISKEHVSRSSFCAEGGSTEMKTCGHQSCGAVKTPEMI